MREQGKTQETRREEFRDGSAVLTYPDGSVAIIESRLAKESVLRDTRPVNYNAPAPPPPGTDSLGRDPG
jgi:hypothetical protein